MKVVYKNILSDISVDDEDIEAKAKSDYDELLTKYFAGNEIESPYPNAKVVKKELHYVVG